MKSLNDIAYEVGHRFDRAYDTIFRNRIKDLIIDIRSTLSERRFRQGKPILGDYIQDLGALELTKVDLAEAGCAGLSIDCTVLRTVEKLPEPIPMGKNEPFYYVGSIDKATPYGYLPQHHIRNVSENKYSSRYPRYGWRNQYVYIYLFGKWAKAIKYINVMSPFADPRDAERFNKCEGADCYTDSDRFPMPRDLVSTVQDMVVEKLGGTDSSKDDATGVTTKDIPSIPLIDFRLLLISFISSSETFFRDR
jgi:hypothetical protein